MSFRLTKIACAIAFLLVTCTSCRVENLDLNGDGFVSKGELLAAAFDALCGDQSDLDAPDDEQPNGETPDGDAADGETPNDEVPNGENE